MGGAYNTTKGNDKIYAPKVENEIKLNAKKEEKNTLKANLINRKLIMQPTCPTLTMHIQNNVRYNFASFINSLTMMPKCWVHYMLVN